MFFMILHFFLFWAKKRIPIPKPIPIPNPDKDVLLRSAARTSKKWRRDFLEVGFFTPSPLTHGQKHRSFGPTTENTDFLEVPPVLLRSGAATSQKQVFHPLPLTHGWVNTGGWPYTTSQLPRSHTSLIFLIVHANVTLNIVISHEDEGMRVSMKVIFLREICAYPDGLLFINFGVSNCIDIPVQIQRIQSQNVLNLKQFHRSRQTKRPLL